MAKCTGVRCPMQHGYKVDEGKHTDCQYRTEPVTNADRIRAMSDEELGKYLCWLAGCHDCEGRSFCEHPDFKSGDGYTKWLKQPAK